MNEHEATIGEATARGRSAGELHLSSSLNPYPDGSPLAKAWETARDSEARRIALSLSQVDDRIRREKETPSWQRELARGARDPDIYSWR